MISGRREIAKALVHSPFVICVLVLVAAAVTAGPMAKRWKLVLRKEPVPLRKRLSDLDKKRFGDYEFVRANTIDKAVLPSLGTDVYIDWEFVDRSIIRAAHPLRNVRLSVFYYTGRPSFVPHVSEVCYLASGYQLDTTLNESMKIERVHEEPIEVPLRAATFVKSRVFYKERPTVVYTFHCNGKFVRSRDAVRRRLATLFHKGAYFCKVELKFGGTARTNRQAPPEETVEAAKKFLQTCLPLLLEEHLPDWEAVQAGAGRPANPA